MIEQVLRVFKKYNINFEHNYNEHLHMINVSILVSEMNNQFDIDDNVEDDIEIQREEAVSAETFIVENNQENIKESCENAIDMVIYFTDEENPIFFVMEVGEVCKIPSRYRNKIKDYILNFNTACLCGTFGIAKKSPYVEFMYPIFTTFTKSGQAQEINRIPRYMSIIAKIVTKVREDIKEIIHAADGDDNIE